MVFGVDDAIMGGLAIAGLGLELWGGNKQAEIAKQEAGVSQQIIGSEQQINAQKMQLTQLQASRSQLQIFRNRQRLLAQSTAAAVNQGSSVGTGLQSSGYKGGQAEITNAGIEGSLGIGQGLQIAQNVFGINQDISQAKIKLAGLQGQQATAQGITSLGGSVMQSAGIFGKFGADIFSGRST